jgi:hypothetical protein
VFQNRYGISFLVSQYLEHSRNHLCSRKSNFKASTKYKKYKYFTVLPGALSFDD